MADTTDQASGFWTLSRQPKLSKRRNSDLHELHHKIFNVAVVGFSGTERDKGPIGIGKSCLCNRFVRSAADDYHTDHISVLSQTDFNGHVVNNDHWLYWGSVIKSCDGYDLAFNVIEQTEFVDDICFQSFQSGKTEPYHKRCANTKLISPEKLMYICKNQLGIEKEYEQRYLPDGKFNVDGFLCLFDVSDVQGRSLEKQSEMTNMIMLNIIKTKKPVVFVTTKHDEASEQLVAEAERLISQRDFRGLIPVVETSAQENVNINIAFLICAQLIDRTRTKIRIPPFMEAYRNQMELLNAASNAYINLIQSTVVDLRISWQQVCIKLSHNPEFLQYTYLLGLDRASAVFKEHIKSLQQECINRKVQIYMKSFPEVLNTLLPVEESTSSGNSQDTRFSSSLSPQAWEMAKKHIKTHPLAPKYFFPVPDGVLWYETEILESTENRIPTDWLDSEEAYSIYRHRCLQQETERKRLSSKELFAQILRDTDIPVGTPFFEVKHRFESNCDLEILTDQELFDIYVEYQNDMLQQARANFQELLLENAEHLQQLTTSDKVIRQEDIKTINAILQHDERYQALEGFEQDRTLMMIRHLSFLHSQISEQCPSYPRCIEPEIERLLITKAKSLVSMFCEGADREGKSSSMKPPKSCDIVIFGPRRPSQQLILALNVLNSRAAKSSQYQITFTVFDNADEIDAHFQRFGYQSTKKLNGCFGIFTNQRSLEHVSLTLERFMQLNTHAHSEINHFGGPPVVMLYAADITLDERTMLALENDGQQLADKFKCPFMNVTAIDQYRQHQQNNLLRNEQDSSSQVMSECASLDYACVEAAFNVLKEAISRRVCFMELYNNQDLIPRQAFNPDARILMCLLCGDPFSRESFIWEMFLDYPDCYVTSSKSICLKMTLEDGQEKFIEIVMTSYTHGALNYREDLLHGFILVCSTERKASISILNAFSFNIPCTPVLVMAIMNLEGQKSQAKSNRGDPIITEDLVREAECTADQLKGHFELYELGRRNASNSNRIMQRFKLFLHSVIKRKPLIERAYEIGDIEQSGYSDPVALEGVTTCKQNTTTRLNADRSDLLELRRTTLSKAAGPMYDVDDKLDDTNGNLDKNTSRETGGSNSNQTKISTFDKYPAPMPTSRLSKRPETGLHMESHVTQDEHTTATKRPLPPIPTAQDHHAQNRAADLPKKATAAAANPSGQTKSRPTTTNIPGKPQQQERELQQQQQSQQQRQSQLNSEETIDSDHSSDDDTEDSVDAKNKKAKPGRLDLRQFDNITTAIGKLNIQPTSTPQAQPKSSETSYSRRLQNSRHKHGRAVAPPKLPPGSSNKSSNEPATELPSPQPLNEETGGLDFSQSPIAQRLLKYSHDHKVSELSSPYESDPDVPVTSSRVPKLNKVSKALSSDKSSPTSKMALKNAPSDFSELITSRDETIKQLNQILAKPPTRPGANARMTRGVSLDQQPETSDQPDLKKNDKDAKKDKKKLRSDEKLEKQRHKEEERQRRLEKKSLAKKSKSNPTASELNEDGVPLFIKRCIEFIEFEGLDAEGIYRVPGNRAHVETFVQKFKENPDMSIVESDIPVNAVATALKDFLSKKWGPIIPLAMMNELTELSKISDKEGRLMAIKQLLNKLPVANYKLLKYVFGHFVKISLNHSLNSMDSKNLAICWWPTLLPLHFNDMVMFEQMRPHLEESIQTMIDQYEFIFDSEEPNSPQALMKT